MDLEIEINQKNKTQYKIIIWFLGIYKEDPASKVGARKCHKVFGSGQGCLHNEAKKIMKSQLCSFDKVVIL